MDLGLQIVMNKKLFIRNPEDTELGKEIIRHSILLIHKSGFELFTFKKLAVRVGTTEAGVYRYFENKHKLLVYIVSLYWSYLEYKIVFHTNNLSSPELKLKKIIQILGTPVKDDVATPHIDEQLLYEIVMLEGAKAFMTRQVAQENKQQLFKPFNDLCSRISSVIQECNPKYEHPRSLSSTIIEAAHFQNFFMRNLPSLTDYADAKDEKQVIRFLENLVFDSLFPLKVK